MLQSRGRRREALVLVKHALELALEQDKPSAALRAYNNVADILNQADRYEEAEQVLQEGIGYARKVGNRSWERSLSGQVYAPFMLGKWDQAVEQGPALLAEDVASARLPLSGMLVAAVAVYVHRGELPEAEAVLRHVRRARALRRCARSALRTPVAGPGGCSRPATPRRH